METGLDDSGSEFKVDGAIQWSRWDELRQMARYTGAIWWRELCPGLETALVSDRERERESVWAIRVH